MELKLDKGDVLSIVIFNMSQNVFRDLTFFGLEDNGVLLT